MTDATQDGFPVPNIADRSTFESELNALRLREKAHTHERDAISAARRRLPMVKVDSSTKIIGEKGETTLLEAFEGRRMLMAYYFMWHEGKPAPEQCEGCTWIASQMHELSYLHSRDITFAVFAQGPFAESFRYRNFLGWEMPWYAPPRKSLETLLVGRTINMMHLVCYLRQGSDVFETWWTTRRGVEVMDNSLHLMDLTIYGRQEKWEDSPEGWPKRREGRGNMRDDGRPIPQWKRLKEGHSDDLGNQS